MTESTAAPATEAPDSATFFRNWVFWTSLVAAVPGAAVAAFLVLGAKDNGGQFNWMMATVSIVTFLVSAAAAVLPLLLALGFFMGGQNVAVEASPGNDLEDSEADHDIEADEDAFGEDSFDADEDDAFEADEFDME